MYKKHIFYHIVQQTEYYDHQLSVKTKARFLIQTK
jgi:hypothetical protein